MLLEITLTLAPATDLGYLLGKNPARLQEFSLPFGTAHVFYPERAAERCTAALLVEVDPIALVRSRPRDDFALAQYVNDRPYVASSLLSVAMSAVFSTALSGRSKERPDLASVPLPLAARVSVVPCRGAAGEALLRRLFEPLGYEVAVDPCPLDSTFPEWGAHRYATLAISAQVRLHDLLTHLYVLLPALDGEKHYWVGDDEVDKLLRRGEGWLPGHPEKAWIAARYLKHRRDLVRAALSRLTEEEAPDDADPPEEAEEKLEAPMRLNEQRLGAVLAALRAAGARRVIDLGCGSGRLVEVLLRDAAFDKVVGVEVCHRALGLARARLERLPERQRARGRLLQGSLTYRDRRLEGFDAAALVEVVEHLDAPRLAAMERSVFSCARPRTVVLTTPNVEYNGAYGLAPGTLRHRDHRFEWTRAEFAAWCERVCDRFGYSVRPMGVGSDDPQCGPPTQMGIFQR